MKPVKLFVFTLTVTIGLLLMGEINLLNLLSFQDRCYSADFYISKEESVEESRNHVTDFINAGVQMNVDFFAVEYQWNKDYKNTITITGTLGALNKLQQQGIREGVNSSLFFPSEEVEFVNLTSRDDISGITTIYFLGSESDYEAICGFKSLLVDRYGGGFPHEKGSSLELYTEIIAVWMLIFFLNLAISWYEAMSMKKENMVKLILGRNVTSSCLKSIVAETITVLGMFALLLSIFSKISNVSYKLEISAAMLAVYTVLNAVIELRSIKTDCRRTLANGEEYRHLLSFNYTGKIILTALTVIVLMINIAIAQDAHRIGAQKDFFTGHTEYSYYKLGYEMGNESYEGKELPEETMYRALYEKFQDCSLQYLDFTGNYNIKYPFVTLNRNAFMEVCSDYPQLNRLKKQVLNNRITMLFPEGMSEDSDEYRSALEMNDGAYFAEREYGTWEKTTYERGVRIEAVHNDGMTYQMHRYADPVILVDSTHYSTDNTTGYEFYSNYDIMYNIPRNQFAEFAEEYGLEEQYISITGVNEEFNYIWNQEKGKLNVAIVLLFAMLLLDVSIVLLIINMEYRANAVEMAVKKTLGYSLMDRNSKLVKASIVSRCVGVAVAIVTGTILRDIEVLIVLLPLVLGLAIIEILIIMIKAMFVEKKRINTILKGEEV